MRWCWCHWCVFIVATQFLVVISSCLNVPIGLGSSMATFIPGSTSISCSPNNNDDDNEEFNKLQSLLEIEANFTVPAMSHLVKRQSYISWDDYFVGIALLSALRSKDPHTQSGACIVNSYKRIVGIGYNGFPQGCSDDVLPWAHQQQEEVPWLHTKHPYEVPAEINAVLNKCGQTQGSTMYVAHLPSHECAKIIIQSGIREVVYVTEPTNDSDSIRAARILFHLSGVTLRKYVSEREHIKLQLHDESNNKGDQTIPCNDVASISVNGVLLDHARIESKYYMLLQKEANYTIPPNSAMLKRQSYLSWDDYFLCIASLSAQRSKDPNTQVGACIVNPAKRIVGIGYNGFPWGCSDDVLPWKRQDDSSMLHTKYPYVCHAEANAILNKGATTDIQGSTIYVDLFPCNECAKLIIQSGIQEVVYLRDVYHDTDNCRASRILFQMSRVNCRKHQPSVISFMLDLRRGVSSFYVSANKN